MSSPLEHHNSQDIYYGPENAYGGWVEIVVSLPDIERVTSADVQQIEKALRAAFCKSLNSILGQYEAALKVTEK